MSKQAIKRQLNRNQKFIGKQISLRVCVVASYSIHFIPEPNFVRQI